jgi:molybdate transport system substrate-binding protein
MRFIFAALMLLLSSAHAAEHVSVAAAANLVYALEVIDAAFARTTPEVAISVTTGASGNLFAQISHGAPFDIFLSADTEYPQRVVDTGHGDPATLRIFARGRLVLWSGKKPVGSSLAAALRDPMRKKIALANPATAPYGRAAQQTLERLGLWSPLQPRLVFGESIAQVANFVDTGNADAGFVALSLLLAPHPRSKDMWCEVPEELHAPLDHACVLTTRGTANPAARRYLDFLRTDAARNILRQFGYDAPP